MAKSFKIASIHFQMTKIHRFGSFFWRERETTFKKILYKKNKNQNKNLRFCNFYDTEYLGKKWKVLGPSKINSFKEIHRKHLGTF